MPDNPIKFLTNMLETVERRETNREREREGLCGPKRHLTNNFIDTHKSRREHKQHQLATHTAKQLAPHTLTASLTTSQWKLNHIYKSMLAYICKTMSVFRAPSSYCFPSLYHTLHTLPSHQRVVLLTLDCV